MKILSCKQDILGMICSDAPQRRYLGPSLKQCFGKKVFEERFLHRFRPNQRWDTKDWWWLYTSNLIAAEQRGGWLFIFKPGFRFVLVMFFSTSKISRFFDRLCNSRFSIGFELVLTTLTNQWE